MSFLRHLSDRDDFSTFLLSHAGCRDLEAPRYGQAASLMNPGSPKHYTEEYSSHNIDVCDKLLNKWELNSSIVCYDICKRHVSVAV